MAARSRKILVVAAGSLACLLAAAVAVEGARYRLQVVVHKATGRLPDVPWGDLLYALDPRSGVWLQPLAQHPDPFVNLRAPAATDADLSNGRAIFRSRCAACHGVGGDGGTGPALVGRFLTHGQSDWALYRVIRRGVPRTAMVPQPLSRRETWQVVAHLQSLSRPATATERSIDADDEERPDPPVTAGRLLSSSGHVGLDGWLTYSGSYTGQRHAAVSDITRDTVNRLQVAWIRVIDGVGADGVQSTPLVNGSTMFVTAPPQRVLALSATTGAVRWQYSRALPADLVRGYGTVNRGVALFDRLVFVGTLDAHLVALDADTGRVRWDVEVAPYKEGYTITGAPLAVNGLVIVGISGGDYPIRGFIDAYDTATGERRWRFYTIPAPGEPGSQTWSGDAWRTGGAATWLTGSYDPESNLLLWGVGNPSPGFAGDLRAGDNLYSNSVVAIDASTGRLAWHFQFTPQDEFDWDAAQIPVLADLRRHGGPERSLLWANRNGFYYLLDAATGAFRHGVPFVRQNWASGLDENGRPKRVAGSSPSAHGTLIYPHKHGGTSWWSPAFNPGTGLFYVPAFDGPMMFFRSGTPVPRPDEQYLGGSYQHLDNEPPRASVKALTPTTGAPVWEYRPAEDAAQPIMGLLSTAGGLVFASHATRLVALDAATGAELWRFDTGQSSRAAPISVQVDGRQYVVITTGALVLAFSLPAV